MKYIIELEMVLTITGSRYFVKDTNTAVDDCILKHLTPYTEPTEHDGCEGCKHFESYYTWCINCYRNPSLTDHYEAKPKKTIKRWEKYEGDFQKAALDYQRYCDGMKCSSCDYCDPCNGKSCFAAWLMEDIEVDE